MDASAGLGERIDAVLAIDPAAPALEFGGRWRTWGELEATSRSVAAALPAAGARVGVLLRNRPAHVAFLLGVLRGGGCVVAIDPQRGAALAGLVGGAAHQRIRGVRDAGGCSASWALPSGFPRRV